MNLTTATFGPADLERLQHEHQELRVIDVRTPAEFAAGHIRGSYNVPLPDLGEHRAELTTAAAGPVVLVCQSGRRATTASTQLQNAGLTNVYVLDGGVEAWKSTGRPLLELHGAPGWSLERQVRAVAGGLVATAVAVSIVWPPARFGAGAIGAGLLIAALTNTCAMGNVLARLPYNRRSAAGCDLPSVVATLTADATTSGEVGR